MEPPPPPPPTPRVDLTGCRAMPSPYYSCLLNFDCADGRAFQTACKPTTDGPFSCLCLNSVSGTLEQGEVPAPADTLPFERPCELATSLCAE